MEYKAGEYEVIVIGAGHAGCEAALAAARKGCKTAIFCINLDSIANMPCNPSIGGTAKGHLVREIDALGGQIGKTADKTLIQSKMLNTSKGPAVYSLRAQIDRRKYQEEMKIILEKQVNLDVKQAEITDLIIENNQVKGVKTHTGAIYNTKTAIIATGTFLKGKIVIGDISYSGGPDGIFPANKLSESMLSYNIEIQRFKTGTPPRINKRSIDFSKMEIQYGDKEIVPFSFETKNIDIEQTPCWLTYTNKETHEIIKKNIHRSPLFSGSIEGIGPRYCPSIEDKVVRFKDKEKHQIFIEPMGEETQEMYLGGLSSSLPEDVQVEIVRSLEGLEKAEVMRSAYAIEYDCINPQQLNLTLEFKKISGLYCAGQSNGSSGYEEAAAQGLIAGINAANKIKNKDQIILDRANAYIGVLIDDLVTKGTTEPYRMMTSRAEYRLLLRQDNADERLIGIGKEEGLINDERYNKYVLKYQQVKEEIERLKNTMITPKIETQQFLEKVNSARIKSGIKLSELLKRPEVTYENSKEIDSKRPCLDKEICEQAEIQIKYEGYIKKQQEQVNQFKKLETKKIPISIKYMDISGLKKEAAQKLEKVQPKSIGQASRISGVSPSDINVLNIYIERSRRKNESN